MIGESAAAAVRARLESPPQVRVEWLVAATRVVLAAGSLVAVALAPTQYSHHVVLTYALTWYLVYSLGMLALVWAPVRFARGWHVAVHLVDLGVFALLMATTRPVSSPFFMGFLFLLVCGTLRWQVRGTLWTAAATAGAYVGMTAYTAAARGQAVELNTFVIHLVSLAVVTILLAYLGGHQHRFQKEIVRIAAWPRRLPRHSQDVIAEVLSQARALLDAPRLVLAWEPRDDKGQRNLAWSSEAGADWIQEPACDPLVTPSLETRSFQTHDARREGATATVVTSAGFARRRGRVIPETVRARFDMQAVQSWPLDGELIQGRMFGLDKSRMRIDDLIVGEVVASLVASRLEAFHIVERLREAAALDERVRLARDLHDSLLQSQAGAALQLLAARRLLDRNPVIARQRLNDVQHQLERGELEMRSFINELRPSLRAKGDTAADALGRRLEDLAQRIERQWDVTVDLRLDESVEQVPAAIRDDVYRLVQEAVVNAARHSEASVITAALFTTGEDVRLEVDDDGRGFPFHGTYDLAGLNRMNEGPLTLKERVAQLAGELTLSSMSTGTSLRMRVPFRAAAAPVNG